MKRCPTGKKPFGSKLSAQAAAERIGRTGLDFYKCDVCSYWHQGRSYRRFNQIRKLEDTLASLRKEFKKLVTEHLDKYRQVLVDRAAQSIAEDMQKEAARAELEIKCAWAQREFDDNERIGRLLTDLDPEAKQPRP